MRPAIASVVLLTLGAVVTAAAADRLLVQRDVYLMGTRALLVTSAPDRHTGMTVLERVLDVLEETEAQLSTWRSDSAISRLNASRVGDPWPVDASLCGLLADLYRWRQETGGAFDPAVGALAAAWRIHDAARIPDGKQLEVARTRTGLGLLEFNRANCSITRRADVTLDAGAFGKGEALDRVARALPDETWLIDLGGQVAVNGALPDGQPWMVDVAHPHDRHRAVMQVELRAGSLSTSGGSERDVHVGDTRVGHILDPRSGRPALFNGSVVVWHERALLADILSTALYVMGPEEGLPWAESHGIAAAYLMTGGNGLRTAPTSRFRSRLNPTVPE